MTTLQSEWTGLLFFVSTVLLAFLLCFIVLFQSCCSHAQVFGKTLVHEFPIFYSHTEWNCSLRAPILMAKPHVPRDHIRSSLEASSVFSRTTLAVQEDTQRPLLIGVNTYRHYPKKRTTSEPSQGESPAGAVREVFCAAEAVI